MLTITVNFKPMKTYILKRFSKPSTRMGAVAITLLLSFSFNTIAAAACRSSLARKVFIQAHPKKEFLTSHSLPATAILWVDHICALECGGLDSSVNMQWQTEQDARAKDRWERTATGCASTCTSVNSLPYRTVFNCK